MLSLASPSLSVAEEQPLSAVPVIGVNSNVLVDGVEFHVQTEDLGPRHPHLVTHVFRDGGCVVKSMKLDYSEHVGKPNLRAILPRVMKAHHVKVIRSLQRGRLDSIPPCVTMHRTQSEESPHLLDLARQVGVEDLPGTAAPSNSAVGVSPASEPPPTVRSGTGISPRPPIDTSPKPSANLWDRLVGEAHREYPGGGVSGRCGQKSVGSAWERALESTKQTRSVHEDHTGRDSEPGFKAYAEGLAKMDNRDARAALVCFAQAIQAEPDKRQYRAALRDALDRLDANEQK